MPFFFFFLFCGWLAHRLAAAAVGSENRVKKGGSSAAAAAASIKIFKISHPHTRAPQPGLPRGEEKEIEESRSQKYCKNTFKPALSVEWWWQREIGKRPNGVPTRRDVPNRPARQGRPGGDLRFLRFKVDALRIARPGDPGVSKLHSGAFLA
jgi:hypothetical protein